MRKDVQLNAMEKDIEKALKRAIIGSGLSYYRLGLETGVSDRGISWFIQGKRTLRLDIAAKLAAYLELELTPVNPAERKGEPVKTETQKVQSDAESYRLQQAANILRKAGYVELPDGSGFVLPTDDRVKKPNHGKKGG